MKNFTTIWFGQLISLFGTGMTNFAVSYWIFEQTGEATALTWAIFAFIAPGILFSPLAGALVDRYDRKLIMILTDVGAGLGTLMLLLLVSTNQLQLWHIYLINAFVGIFESLQFPAYSAAVTVMMPKEQYGRASGMIGLAGAASGILSPVFAGALLGPLGLSGIMFIDLATFLVAIGTLAIVQIPKPEKSGDGRSGQGSLWQESLYGFRYILARPSLLGLQLMFFQINFVAMFSFALLVPMILSRTGNNELALSSVQSVGAIGGVLGGLLLSAWGGPKRKVHGVLGGMVLISFFGQVLMGLGRGVWIWSVSSFIGQAILPILNGSNQAIWQAKVAPDIQGRVFSVRRLIAQVTAPLATAVAGPLADNFFEPAFQTGGVLTSFSWLVGSGPGAGIAFMFVISGLAGVLMGASGYLFPAIRDAERILPDHDALKPTAGETAIV